MERPFEQPRREYLGWIFLAILFSLIISAAVSGNGASDSSAIRLSESESALQNAVAVQNSKDRIERSEIDKNIDDLQKSLTPYRFSDPISAEIYAASSTLQGKALTSKDLQPMVASKNVLDRNAASVYGSKALSRGDAERLSVGFDKRGFLGQLMRAQALAKSGDRTAIQKLTRNSSSSLAFGGLIALLIGAGSISAWAFVIAERRSGRLVPQGMPMTVPTLYDADRLALRAASLMGLYVVLSVVPDLIGAATHIRLNPDVSQLMVGAAVLIAVPVMFLKPILGRVVTLAEAGIVPNRLPRLIGIGLLGFVLEIPIAVILGVIGQALFAGIHHASHPTSVALSTRHDPLTVISSFVLACIVAPFWEELMFRGLLFPAVTRVTGRAIYGAVATSFLFGALHPQGVPIWFALMAFAGMSCTLSYYTKSLVPSMVMHSAHNATLLALTLLYS